MAIADWEQTILNAFAQTGEQAPGYLSNYDSPWERGGTAALQGVVDGTYGQGQPPGGGIIGGYGAGGGIPQIQWTGGAASSGGIPDMGRSNPNMQGQIDYLRQQSDFALGQNLNGIRSNAVGVGGLGGTRQGVAQGIATGLANQGYTGAVSNMLGQDWTNQQNRDLQSRGLDVQMRGQDIGWQNQTNQYGLQRDALDSQLVTNGINQSWAPIINAGNLYSQLGGGSVTNSTNTGGGIQGLLGGALGGAQLYKAWGV